MDTSHAAHAFSFTVKADKVPKLKADLKRAADLCRLHHLILDGHDENGATTVRISVSGENSWVTAFGEMMELVSGQPD